MDGEDQNGLTNTEFDCILTNWPDIVTSVTVINFKLDLENESKTMMIETWYSLS